MTISPHRKLWLKHIKYASQFAAEVTTALAKEDAVPGKGLCQCILCSLVTNAELVYSDKCLALRPST